MKHAHLEGEPAFESPQTTVNGQARLGDRAQRLTPPAPDSATPSREVLILRPVEA